MHTINRELDPGTIVTLHGDAIPVDKRYGAGQRWIVLASGNGTSIIREIASEGNRHQRRAAEKKGRHGN